MTSLTARIERFPVGTSFVIARGAKSHVDVLWVEARDGDLVGHGEGTSIYYLGDSVERCVGKVRALDAAGLTRATLAERMPPGAARNAVDAALWDLEAQRAGVPVWRLAGLDAPRPFETALTISLGTPEEMGAAAEAASAHALLKLKLGGQGDRGRVAAVRAARPDARLIADANESWGGLDVAAEAAALAALGVELIEQPLPAGADDALGRIDSPVPLCADESCHSRADLDRLAGRYQAINVKLDKAGGLTEAIALIDDARARGLKVMLGCMLSTSLGIAPAALLAARADWVDLDGPLLLAWDRPGGFRVEGGEMVAGGLWGGE